MSTRLATGLVLAALLGLVGVFVLLNADNRSHDASYIPERVNQKESSSSEAFIRSDLLLPFSFDHIHPTRGEINPLGVVRFSKDEGAVGHSGIDIPLVGGSPIYAVGDGLVVLVKSAGDPWGGEGIYQLLEPTREGEGWAFLYEHVTPAPGVTEGAVVKAGDVIATKTAPDGFTVHLQLSYNFNDYKYTRDPQCWPEFLGASDASLLSAWWEKRRTSDKLISAWRTNDEEGKYPFRGLLDHQEFPNGPQLCYPAGTDVR